jgi:hypothetical protein
METRFMNRQHHRHARLIVSSTLIAASLAACGGGSDDAPAPTVTMGAVVVSAQLDAPSCGMDAVYVSVNKIRFHQSAVAAPGDSGWTELSFSPAKRVNLLNPASVLSGATTDLGEVPLPVGSYAQVRLVLDANSGGTSNTVKPGGAAAETPLETGAVLASEGFRMPIELVVDSGTKARAVLDFDACNSIQRRGAAYVLKPRARFVPAAPNGITGFVDKAVLASGVVVTAQQGGAIHATTVPNPATGEFALPRLLPGKYEVVIQGKDRATAVIGAVPVDAGSTVAVSTAAAPVTLAASATGTISGQVTYAASKTAPDSGTWVQASQTIPANTTVGNAATIVTYRFQPVDLGSGAYTLTDLPRTSVQFALYKPAVTLVPAKASTSLGDGRYRVEAVATGYSNTTTTASANVNLSSVSQSGINIELSQ